MPAPPIEEILTIMPEIERVLGKTAVQIQRMSLRELAEAAFDKGYRWHILPGDGAKPGLTIKVADPEPTAQRI